MIEIAVLGGGRMASAYSLILKNSGIKVSENPPFFGKDILTAFFSGKETLSFLKKTDLPVGTIVIDLTTQSIPDVLNCVELALKQKIIYFAGGVTGGVQQIGTDNLSILIGSSSGLANIPDWLNRIGRVRIYESIESAVAAKLLHNFSLIIMNHVLGAISNIAENNNITDIIDVLKSGTAGRPFEFSSVMRDRSGIAISSYSSELVAKDLRAIISSFPELKNMLGISIDELISSHDSFGETPYTILAQSPFRRSK